VVNAPAYDCIPPGSASRRRTAPWPRSPGGRTPTWRGRRPWRGRPGPSR